MANELGANHSTAASSKTIDKLDQAVLALRRFWSRPQLRVVFLERLVEPDLNVSLYRVLYAVGTLSAPSMRDIAEQLKVDPSTASRLVDVAVDRGLVARAEDPFDRRRCILKLNDEGSLLFERMRVVRREILSEVTEGWSRSDVENLVDLLDRLLSDADRYGPL